MSVKVSGQIPPLVVQGEGRSRRGASGTVVPVAGIGEISFLAVKVSVDPGAVGIGNFRAQIVGLVPATGTGQPQRAQFVGESFWRGIVVFGGLIQFGCGHVAGSKAQNCSGEKPGVMVGVKQEDRAPCLGGNVSRCGVRL